MKKLNLLFTLGLSLLFFDLFSQKKGQEKINTSIFDNIPVRNIGPAKVSGRITKVIKDYSNTSTWYVTTASGNVCRTETRYNEEARTVYSHSTITFVYEGKQYKLNFKK